MPAVRLHLRCSSFPPYCRAQATTDSLAILAVVDSAMARIVTMISRDSQPS